MEECTENVSLDQIKATVASIGAQDKGDATWISALNVSEALLEMDQLPVSGDQGTISNDAIKQAQRQDQEIGRVIAFKLEGKRPSIQDTKKESRGTKDRMTYSIVRVARITS